MEKERWILRDVRNRRRTYKKGKSMERSQILYYWC
jgi:hypothetical protein